MAKLYWRIKRNGKWTWIAATPENLVLWDTKTLGRAERLPSNVVPHYYDHNWEDEVVEKPEVYSDDEQG